MFKKILTTLLLLSTNAYAAVFPITPAHSDVIGHDFTIHAKRADSLEKIARHFDTSVDAITDANPNLKYDNSLNLKKSADILIPLRFILPGKVRQGIVINLSETRLYYYIPNSNKVFTAPVAIGRVGWQTPMGETKIIEKKEDPSWTPPDSVRQEVAKKGIKLPDVVPPGPNNPLGKYMLRLAWHSYLIHGTNRPYGVGNRVTAGCIRMYPEDIARLYPMIEVGTPVRIIDEPIKVGMDENEFVIEVHTPLAERGQLATRDTIKLVNKLHKLSKDYPVLIKFKFADKIVSREDGVVTTVGVHSLH